MRIFRRGWISTRRLMVLAAWVLVSLAFLAPIGRLSAQSSSQGQTSPPVDQEWSVRDSQGFRSRNLSLGSLFQIRLDGRTLSPTWSSDKSSSSSSSSSSSTQKSGSSSNADRKPIDTKVEFQAEYPVKPVSVVRHMRLDPKRRAVRILDVFTNTESQERSLRIDYQTYLSERGGTRFGGVLNQAGESREYGNGVPDDTVTALIFAERQDSPALPLFVWGQSGARWPVSVQDISSNVSLSYEGTIPGHGKIALLHWVAVAGQDKSVKIERTSELFWKDGRLIDPMVPADIAPLVVNFTPESLKASAPTADTTSALASGRLIHLEELCGKLSVSRGAKDLLWMGKDEQFSGTLTGTAVQLRSGGGGSGNVDRSLEKTVEDIAGIPKGGRIEKDDSAIEIPLADIAGIRGGGGRGREHRVYLRNGTVLIGRASLKDCRLTGELGELTLDADAIELLLMRVTSADGKVPDGAWAFAELRNGAVHWLGILEGVNWGPEVQLVTVFGNLSLYSNEIWSLERRAEPPFNLVTVLADGSRIHGVARHPALSLQVLGVDGIVVPTSVRTAEVVRFGATELLARQMALPGSDSHADAGDKGTNTTDKAKTEPPPRYCWLRDGSLLVGTIASPALSLRTGGNEVELKTEDILRMNFDAANGSVANIELRSGAKMQGELVSESVEWQLGSRKITLPVGWLQEVMRKDPPAPPEPPAPDSTVRAPGENNPLALPPGIAKEELVEMKVEYPPAAAEGPLRVWGTLSVPRLDKCDEASVKPRLTFLVPKGTSNVALKKPLTVSAPDSAVGVLTNINDGNAKDDGGDHVALEGGLQWVQIDLQSPHHIWKVLLWHYHRMPVVYQDVIVQVSDDPEFKKEVKTIFNNDHDNSSGLGKGPDTAYVETNYGWLMDGAGAQGRYIRFYSKGNSYSEKNDYLETMVFGTPVGGGAPVAASTKAGSGDETRVMTPEYPKPEPAAFSAPLNVDAKLFPHFQKPDPEATRARLSFKVPEKASMVSVKKPVTCSVASIKPEELSRITNRTADYSDMLELPGGLQWVQIDLGAPHQIFKILAWHRFDYHRRVYHDVVVQVSSDPNFKKEVITLFNNDHDDSAKLGKGSDPAYVETNHGMLIEGRGTTARYVRLYSRGNSEEDKNHYSEVLVAGLKVELQMKPAKTPTPAAEPPSPSPVAPASATPSTGIPPLPPKPEALTAAEAAKKDTAPNDPLSIPKGMSREQLAEVNPNYPKAMFIGTPVPTGDIPNLEKVDPEAARRRMTFLVPKGATEVAQGKKVTSSDPQPLIGTLDLLTDGNADGADGCYVELAPGLQWVQIDLGASHHIWKVLLWHFHKQASAYYDVIVQVSDDPKFEKGVQTIFNNDHDNSSKLGKGPDPVYVGTFRGRLIDGCGAKGRYIRCYSNGSTSNEMNHYIEAMVYGTLLRPKA